MDALMARLRASEKALNARLRAHASIERIPDAPKAGDDPEPVVE
jgi:hypothetical protein